MRRFFSFIFAFSLLFVFSPLVPQVLAADIRSSDQVIVSSVEKGAGDLYLFGNSVEVDAPVENDLITAGGEIDVRNDVQGSIMAAGEILHFKGNTSGSIRAAGKTVIIDGYVGRDLVVAGSNVLVSRTAVITGDLLMAGGNLTINGVVDGSVKLKGGQVVLGREAIIGGDLAYSSRQEAAIANGAIIKGGQSYENIEESSEGKDTLAGFFMAFSFYKLIGDILITIVLIYFFGRFFQTCVARIGKKSFRNGIYGFSFLLLVPLLSFFLLILFWIGASLFLIYFLVIIVSGFLAKIFLGRWVLEWWARRSKKEYVLDWKAGVVGPVLFFVITFIPVLGWLFLAILCLISIGVVVSELVAVAKTQRIEFKRKAATK